MAVLGVDGWRGRWVGALLTGRAVELLVLEDVAAALAVPDVELIAIDMPIGLSDDGARACDMEARRRLSPFGAASSVFPAPVRPVLAAGSYEEAHRISVAASGTFGTGSPCQEPVHPSDLGSAVGQRLDEVAARVGVLPDDRAAAVPLLPSVDDLAVLPLDVAEPFVETSGVRVPVLDREPDPASTQRSRRRLRRRDEPRADPEPVRGGLQSVELREVAEYVTDLLVRRAVEQGHPTTGPAAVPCQEVRRHTALVHPGPLAVVEPIPRAGADQQTGQITRTERPDGHSRCSRPVHASRLSR